MKIHSLILIIISAFILGCPLGCQLAKKYQKITYAHRLTYFGPQPTPTSPWQTVQAEIKDGRITTQGQTFGWQVSFPQELNLKYLPADPHDALGIEKPGKPAHQNLVLYVETIAEYDSQMQDKPQEFVENYWQFYPGLSGLKQIKELTNENGFQGYWTEYLISNTDSTAVNFFFIIKDNPNRLIHLIKGDLSQEVFNQIINSFEY